MLLKHAIQSRFVFDAELAECEVVSGLCLRQTRLLEGHVIVVIHIVDTDHLITARQQAQ